MEWCLCVQLCSLPIDTSLSPSLHLSAIAASCSLLSLTLAHTQPLKEIIVEKNITARQWVSNDTIVTAFHTISINAFVYFRASNEADEDGAANDDGMLQEDDDEERQGKKWLRIDESESFETAHCY